MRAAERILQAGAIAVVVAASTFNAFELDRFFVAKELVLHVSALLAGLFAFRALRRMTFTRADTFLAAFIALSAVSALFATNRWLGLRAVAISASAALIFWVARACVAPAILPAFPSAEAPPAGLPAPQPPAPHRTLINGLALAVVLVAMTSLLQAYGLDVAIFSENRIPGGTLGNRNFVAHAAAFGFPLLIFSALLARRFALAATGISITTAALVLTRSRAAWLAFAAVMVVFHFAMLAAPALRRDRRTWTRMAALGVFAVIGVAAALVIPNTLKWRSRNPYVESMQRVTDFKEGSGRGRLVQYERSMVMALHHPIFGAGPGNWAVVYPHFAVRDDPSMSDSAAGMTFNPWPSSDWIAFVSERGIVAAALFALFFASVALGALRQLRIATDFELAARAAALLGVAAGAIVTGLFDAVLLLALPAYIVFAAIGALAVPHDAIDRPRYRMAIVAFLALSAIGAARSTAQLVAMDIYVTRSDRASLARGAAIDPGNYRLQLRLGRGGRTRDRCPHARAAHALYPNAVAARDAARGCGE